MATLHGEGASGGRRQAALTVGNRQGGEKERGRSSHDDAIRYGVAPTDYPCDILNNPYSPSKDPWMIMPLWLEALVELVENAGHFLQEDQGEEVAARIVAFLAATD